MTVTTGRRTTIPVRVHSVVNVTPRMVEIRLRAPALAGLRFSPASHVVVRVPVPGGTVRRVYSVWSPDRLSATIRLRIALHEGGAPGCAWAQRAQAGDEILIEPPRTKIAPVPEARYHLLAGEETGAVPLQAIRAALYRSPDSRGEVYGVLESVDQTTEVPGATGVPALPWVHRGDASARASAILLDAVRDLVLPDEPGVAYLAGETTTCQLLQQHLIQERGWPRAAVKVQQQWALDRPGFGAGRDEPATAYRPARGRW